MQFSELITKRRSIRKYTGEAVSEDNLEQVIKSGLMAFSGRNLKPWEFIVVRDKAMLESLSHAKDSGSAMLAGADAAIVVIADKEKTDVWHEDCSVAMTYMHLMAADLGLGSCWIQCRLRIDENGGSTEDYVREKLNIPDGYGVEAMLSIGVPAQKPTPRSFEDIEIEKIHKEGF